MNSLIESTQIFLALSPEESFKIKRNVERVILENLSDEDAIKTLSEELKTEKLLDSAKKYYNLCLEDSTFQNQKKQIKTQIQTTKINTDKARLNKAKQTLQKVKAREGTEVEIQPKMYACRTCSSELNSEGICEHCHGSKAKNKMAKEYLNIIGKKNKDAKKKMKKTFKEFLDSDKPAISEAELNSIDKYKVYDKRRGINIQSGISLQSAKSLRLRLISAGHRDSKEIVIRKVEN